MQNLRECFSNMVGKNNNYIRESKSNEHFQRFALRKLSVGVVSVAIAAGFYLGGGTTAQAATTEQDASAQTEQVVTQSNSSAANDDSASVALTASNSAATSTAAASDAAVSSSAASTASTATSENSQAVASTASETPASSANEKNSSASENSQAGSEANKVANESQEMQLPKSAANANEQQTVNDSKAQQNAVNLQPVDPDYPSGMYKDPEESHYSYWWAQSDDGNYNVVLSTDRNGSGNVYVRLLDKDGKNILCDKNHNLVEYITISKSGHETIIARNVHYNWFGNKYYTYDTVGTVYNDGQSGLFQGNGDRWKSKFNVFNLKADEDAKNKSYGDISFMIPQMETQTISYVG